jgi:hypothetical protein
LEELMSSTRIGGLFTASFAAQVDDVLHRIAGRLQLSKTDHRRAEEHYKTIGEWLELDPDLARYMPSIYPQGSMRIGTTVRPLAHLEFDLDIVCEFLEIDWRRIRDPLRLLDAIEKRLQGNEVYKSKVERRNRCIRVKYADRFHLDILPAAPDRESGESCVVVPDSDAQDWKCSNPKGFAAWFESRSKVLLVDQALKFMEPLPDRIPVDGKPPLTRAVQLLKRWRDVKYEDDQKKAPISIVLTALAGAHYKGEGSVNKAIQSIVDGILSGVPPRGKRIVVANPMNQKEDLSERWDDDVEAYRAFVEGIQELRESWRELNLLQSRPRGAVTAADVLKKLFGENVTDDAFKDQAKAIQSAREEGKIGVEKSTGIITLAGGSGIAPVEHNSFYGK